MGGWHVPVSGGVRSWVIVRGLRLTVDRRFPVKGAGRPRNRYVVALSRGLTQVRLEHLGRVTDGDS